MVGPVPDIDLSMERRLDELVLHLIRNGIIRSAHDISDGGIAVTLAECCIGGSRIGQGLGARIEFNPGMRMDKFLFSEGQSRFIISIDPGEYNTLVDAAKDHGIGQHILGEVVPGTFTIKDMVRLDIQEMHDAYRRGIAFD